MPYFSQHHLRSFRKRIIDWGVDGYQDYPWRRTENKWHALVAEILLQRTKAQAVIPVYKEFVNRYPSPHEVQESSPEEISKIIYSLGLEWRALQIFNLGCKLSTRGFIPETISELTNLPGVGNYSASAYLSFKLNKYAIIIDANVVRFLARITGRDYDGETRREAWLKELAREITPQLNHQKFNYSMLDLTMKICTPRRPHCNECPVKRHCKHIK